MLSIRKNFSTILVIFLLASLSIGTIYFTDAKESEYKENYSFELSASFFDDFDSTTYRDLATDASGWGTGTLTNERTFDWTLYDFFSTDYPVRDIDVQGRKAYLSLANDVDGEDDLKILEIYDDLELEEKGSRDAGKVPWALEVSGDVLAAGVGETNDVLYTYNVSNPWDFNDPETELDSITFEGNITDIEIDGHLIYCAVYQSTLNQGIRIINATNPDIIYEITNDWVSAKTYGLAVFGEFLFVAETNGDFTMLNATQKATLGTIFSLNTGAEVLDVIIDGHYAYLANNDSGIKIIDFENPAMPNVIGLHDTPQYAMKLAKQGNTLFVADGDSGLLIFDVADPANPNLFSLQDLGFVYDVALFGDGVLVATDSGVYSYHIDGGMEDISTHTFYTYFDDYLVNDVRVEGEVAYIAGGPDGFYTLDVSNPENPILLDRYELPDPIKGFTKLDIYGSFAYLLEDDDGLFIFDIFNPSDIQLLGGLGANGLQDVFAVGGLLYICGGAHLAIIDATDVYNLEIIFSKNMGYSNATAIWAQGPHLFVVDNVGVDGLGFYMYDISDLKHLYVTDPYYYYPASMYDVYVDGDLAYLANMYQMDLLNISDPFIVQSQATTIYDTYGVWGFGPYIICADMTDGVTIMDASNASDIIEHSRNTGITAAQQITVHGDYAYIANKTSLVIQRILNSAAESFDYGTTSFARSLTVDIADTQINNATLIVDEYTEGTTSIDYFLSADGGTHWEEVTPGVSHTFVNPGSDLRWSATFRSTVAHTPYLYSANMVYYYDAPSTETPTPTPTPTPSNTTTTTDTGGISLIVLSTAVVFSGAILVIRRKRVR